MTKAYRTEGEKTMTDADKTIYKICREQAGYTQERAAELLS